MPHSIRSLCALLVALVVLVDVARAADEPPLVFREDFENGADKWQPLDAKSWEVRKTPEGQRSIA